MSRRVGRTNIYRSDFGLPLSNVLNPLRAGKKRKTIKGGINIFKKLQEKLHNVTKILKTPRRIPALLNKKLQFAKNHGVDAIKWELYGKKKHEMDLINKRIENLDLNAILNGVNAPPPSPTTKDWRTMDWSGIQDIEDDNSDGEIQTQEAIRTYRVPTLTEYFQHEEQKIDDNPTKQVFNSSLNMYIPVAL